ncbi:MAG: CRISPR-associated endonuclease Cas1 [bacterium]|nr:CRISPR-associated endonuclease Cas1 [bacterium]MDE0601869.1 CRISPR-associated endonuclease Cas1 [bacterium]
MLKKFVYCHRLFHLEWADARFQDNADTVEGRYVHRNIDAAGGRIGNPDEDNPVRHARSVLISSERLGLIAKADIIEGRGEAVVPVEVKKGRPPPHGPAWLNDMIQLCVAGLVLRDNGYQCSEGILYFNEIRQRVTIPFDEKLVSLTLENLELLHEVAKSPDPPPPLVDSPKCPRCALVGICLPDETNLHAKRTTRKPRRLTPRDSAARPLYVTEQGARIGIRGGRAVVSKSHNQIESVRMIDVSQVSVYGNVQISSQFMRAAFRRETPVCWFSFGGWFQGVAHGLPSKHVELRRRQVAIASQAGLPIARRIVEGKIRNSRTLLRRNTKRDVDRVLTQLSNLARQATSAPSIESLLGIEGTAARLYFSKFARMLREDRLGTFDFHSRNRRPPRDPVNCLLSFGYSMLVKDFTATVLAVGFDPYLGVYHRPRFGRPALALDLAEEFRPLVAESVVLSLINNQEMRKSNFVVRAQGVAMTSQGRRTFIRAYERRLDQEVTHPTYRYRITYRRVFEVQARMLGAYLLGEIPEYVPFMTR